jgi:hypothetical protein
MRIALEGRRRVQRGGSFHWSGSALGFAGAGGDGGDAAATEAGAAGEGDAGDAGAGGAGGSSGFEQAVAALRARAPARTRAIAPAAAKRSR